MTAFVSSKNFDLTNALRQHVESQAERVKRLTKKISQIKVSLETIARKRNDPKANQAKVVLQVPGKDIAVIKKATDMYQAINLAFHTVARHLRKSQEKTQTKNR